MNLKDLLKAEGFVSSDTVETKVEWEGHSFDVHVRKLSFGDYEAILRTGDDQSQAARMLSKTVFLPDEKRLMSYEEAYQLKAGLAANLVKAVKKVCGLDDPKS